MRPNEFEPGQPFTTGQEVVQPPNLLAEYGKLSALYDLAQSGELEFRGMHLTRAEGTITARQGEVRELTLTKANLVGSSGLPGLILTDIQRSLTVDGYMLEEVRSFSLPSDGSTCQYTMTIQRRTLSKGHEPFGSPIKQHANLTDADAPALTAITTELIGRAESAQASTEPRQVKRTGWLHRLKRHAA